jgi:hypothetical protein
MAGYALTFAEQRRHFPRTALEVIAQEEKGSRLAAVKLMCRDSSGWQRKVLRDCAVI